jgi:general secretion pathway protein K
MNRERGIALVSVLWGVAILSLIAAALLSLSLTSAGLDRNAWNRARASSAADGGVNQAILALLDPRSAHQPRIDGTASTASFDHIPIRIAIQDESGRINVNFAPKDIIAAALAASGTAKDTASEIAGRVVARRGTTNPATPKFAYRALEDLLAVEGMTRAILDRAQPLLTVFGRNETVNQQLAPRAVLAVLPGLDAEAVDRIAKERDRRAQLLAGDDVAGAPLGTPNTVFCITVEATSGNAHVFRIAEVQFTGDVTRPYMILDWR